MDNNDIKYIEEKLSEGDIKNVIIQKLKNQILLTKMEKQYLLRKLDYPTKGIEKEIRDHSMYGPKSVANNKAAHDMQKVLDMHRSFIERINQLNTID